VLSDHQPHRFCNTDLDKALKAKGVTTQPDAPPGDAGFTARRRR
jgi:hypothetical protein